MLMPRDKNVLKFIEDNGSITIYQTYYMFFNESRYGYDLARKRLKKLREMGFLKCYPNKVTNELVYFSDKKPLNTHDVYIFNFYATLKYYNCDIIQFKKEKQWLDGKIRSDGFFIFKFNNIARAVICEIDLSHNTNPQKYEDLFATGELQKKYNGFPLIAIVGESNNTYKSTNFDIIRLNYKLDNFAEKVLAI